MIAALPAQVKNACTDLTCKTCNDHVELLVKQRRETDRENRNKSGIAEDQTEFDGLLDDLITQRDDMEEKRREEKDEKTALDKRLDEAGKELRQRAKSRMSKRASESDESDTEGSGRNKRKGISLDSNDEELDLLKETIADRRIAEKAEMDIDRE